MTCTKHLHLRVRGQKRGCALFLTPPSSLLYFAVDDYGQACRQLSVNLPIIVNRLADNCRQAISTRRMFALFSIFRFERQDNSEAATYPFLRTNRYLSAETFDYYFANGKT